MKTVKTEFGIGQVVTVKILKEEAIVESIKIGTGYGVEYSCYWFHDGDRRSAWFFGKALEMPVGRQKTGFVVEVK